jgi:lipoprotein NlpD
MLSRFASNPLWRFVLIGTIIAAVWASDPQTASAQGGTYHQVQAGDTLEDIARRYGVSAAVVARENRLAANARPVAGTRLYIPGARRPIVSGRASSPAATRPSTQPQQRIVNQRPSTPVSRPAPSASPRMAQPAPSGAGFNTAPRATATLRPRMVTVQGGDSLWKIANENGVSVDELARANGMSGNARLEIGTILVVPVRFDEAGRPTNAGEPPPPVESVPGGGLPRAPAPVLSSPVPAPTLPTQTGRVSARGFQWPIEGRVLRGYEKTSTDKHFGADISAPVGTPVRAARDGVVVYAGRTISAYGNMVIINHDDGLATCYAYNSEVMVRVDQRVARGQVIARSGDDGPAGRAYLHFQIRRRGDAIDPLPYLP